MNKVFGIGTAGQANRLTATTNLQGSLLSDGPVLSANLTDASGWTSTGWTGSYGAGFTHSVGNTSALSRAIAGIASGKRYYITFTTAGRTAGSVNVAIGSSGTVGFTGNAAQAISLIAASGTDIAFTITSDYDGTISAINIQEITTGSAEVLNIADSTNVDQIEIRAPAAVGSFYIGDNAGQFAVNATATDNLAVGHNALSAHMTGGNNTAIGSGALASSQRGTLNTAVGRNAATALTAASAVTAVGDRAGSAITSGGSNTCVGASAGIALSSASACTMVGTSAGGTINASTNIAVGLSSGTNATTGNGNIFIGNASGLSSSTQRSNSIAIGHNARVDTNNACILGASGGDVLSLGIGGIVAPTARIHARGAGTTNATNGLVIEDSAASPNLTIRDDGAVILHKSSTPASASATGTAGQIAWDASYLYICTNSNTWRRIAHATW